MKNYLLMIDGYGNFETDDYEEALNRYKYFAKIGIPVAMYKQIKLHIK